MSQTTCIAVQENKLIFNALKNIGAIHLAILDTIRYMVSALGVPKCTVGRDMKNVRVRVFSRKLKPSLIEQNNKRKKKVET